MAGTCSEARTGHSIFAPSEQSSLCTTPTDSFPSFLPNCILDVARKSEYVLNQVGTELGFARQSIAGVHRRATTVREELFDLVRLQPGTTMDMAHFSYFKQNVQAEFIEEERPAVEEQLRQLLELRQEYQFQLRYLRAALQKSAYTLDHLNADCGGGEGSADDVMSEFTERTAGLREAVTGALGMLGDRYVGNLTRYAIDRPVLPAMQSGLQQTK